MGGSSSQICPEQLEDFQKETSFTAEEITEWYRSFHKKYPSGKMSRKELEKMYSKMFPNGDPARFSDAVFRTMDRDKDDSVDFREYLVAMCASLNGSPEDKLRRAFLLYDKNEDGHISENEMAAIFKSYYRMHRSAHPEMAHEENARNIIDRFDVNGDKKLNFEEFVVCARNMPLIVNDIFGTSSSVRRR